jgi:hypothetical protein
MVHSDVWRQLLIQLVRITAETTQRQDKLVRRLWCNCVEHRSSLSVQTEALARQVENRTTGVHEITWTHDLPSLRACWHTCYVSKMPLSWVGKHRFTPPQFCSLVLCGDKAKIVTRNKCLVWDFTFSQQQQLWRLLSTEMTSCNIVDLYQSFGWIWCLLLQDKGNAILYWR